MALTMSCAVQAADPQAGTAVGQPPMMLDEGLYFDVPPAEVAYNVQIIRLDTGGYATVYHGEPKKTPGMPGDAVKAALQTGEFTFAMPEQRRFAIPNDTEDAVSALYSVGAMWGGAGNPMTVRGRGDHPYFHVFFIAVADDDGDRAGEDYRHHVCQARTRDFCEFDLRVETEGRIAWKPLRPDSPREWKRPWLLRDGNGERIASRKATGYPHTQGLIGSIFFQGGTYHFCYTDRDPDGKTYLFHRTCDDLDAVNDNRTGWSPAVRLSDSLPTGTLIRVAPARDRSHWVVLYNGYRPGPRGLRQDLFLQCTGIPSALGAKGLAGIRWFDRIADDHGLGGAFLGLKSGGGNFSQHDFLTDPDGALTVPERDDKRPEIGGLLTWADFTRGVCGGQVFWATWSVPAARANTGGTESQNEEP
jgi:hypothetical protein